jgi:hypothetical protein
MRTAQILLQARIKYASWPTLEKLYDDVERLQAQVDAAVITDIHNLVTESPIA